MATPFDMSRLPAVDTRNESTRQAIAQALMGRLQPAFDRDENSARTRLANQGITQGSEAWNNEMNRLTQAKNDAMMQAQVQAGSESSRMFGDQSAARQQAIQEQAYLRNLPLSEINALRTGSTPNLPQFQGFGGSQAQAAPLLQGAQLGEQAAIDRYNAKMGSRNALFQTAGQLGSAFLLSGGG